MPQKLLVSVLGKGGCDCEVSSSLDFLMEFTLDDYSSFNLYLLYHCPTRPGHAGNEKVVQNRVQHRLAGCPT